MTSLFLILSALAAPPSDVVAIGGDDVYTCDFENPPDQVKPARKGADGDYDGWPDGWTRRRSAKLPEFVRVAIVGDGQSISDATAEPAPQSVNHSLQMELDGAGAAITSPPIPVSPHYSLLVSLRVKTSGLTHDRAWATFALLDSAGNTLQSFASQPVHAADDWQIIQIGPISPDTSRAVQATISLHLGPPTDDEDLTGSAQFDDVRLVRLPRMTLQTNSPTGLYTAPARPAVICEVSGIRVTQPQVRFELLDHLGTVLATEATPLISAHQPLIASANPRPSDEGHAGQASWTPPVPGYGFYRVRSSLQSPGNSESLLMREQNLAMLRPLPASHRSEFGWSLPAGEQPYAYGPLASVLGQAGLGWAKLPVWYDARETEKADRIAWFAEQLSIEGINLVGVLDQPPKELRQVFREPGRLPVASVFIEPQLWEPVVSPVLTRLSLKVRWWQLGDDEDTSFVSLANVEAKVSEIKRHLEQFGQEIHIGHGWKWLNGPPSTAKGNVPWAFLSYSAEPTLTAAEMASYLDARTKSLNVDSAARPRPSRYARNVPKQVESAPRIAPVRRWLVLSPLNAGEYATDTRVQDLVQRMLAARIHGADAVFLPYPFDAQRGLMNPDGSPGELFVPWRTTASLIGGAEYLGRLQLPGGSSCHAFGRNGNAVIAVWNERPTNERLYLGDTPPEEAGASSASSDTPRERATLGDTVEQIDVWGRSVVPRMVEEEGSTMYEIAVGPQPTFLLGQSAAVARWQATLDFESPRVASVFGVKQSIVLRVQNSFGQGIGGELTLHAPQSWGVDPRPARFKLADGEELRLALPVTLQDDANSGPQQVRLDFEINADRVYKFSALRTLQLGLEDVQMELATRLRDDGALIVEQQIMNLTDRPVSFHCLLFPPGRRRESRQVIHASRGHNSLTFVLPRGEELLGQTLRLRAEEVGGPRVLNCTVTAER